MSGVSEKLRETCRDRLKKAFSKSCVSAETVWCYSSASSSESRESGEQKAPQQQSMESYVLQLEAEIYKLYGTKTDRYRDQLVGILSRSRPANPKNDADIQAKDESIFLNEIHLIPPDKLAKMQQEKMAPSALRRKLAAEEKERQMERLILPEYDMSSTAAKVVCPNCGKQTSIAYNENRNGIDSELHGKQYETIIEDEACSCRLDIENDGISEVVGEKRPR